MPTKLTVAHADESTQNQDGSFFVQIITENEPGYTRTPFNYATLAEAREAAAQRNRTVTSARVLTVRMSSMFAGPVQR